MDLQNTPQFLESLKPEKAKISGPYSKTEI